MNLFIQIPCLNEEATLPTVLAELPRELPGVDEVRIVVIDDGSTDDTIRVAAASGADYIVRNARNLGLAQSFARGLEACLHLGADVIVNTDGDNQYRGADIPALVQPILEGRADVVVGCRDNDANPEFTWFKKRLQRFGSRVVRRLSGTDVPDTTSGFRAFGKAAAMRTSLMNTFSYTLEMLIQAGHTGLKVAWIPIEVNPSTRPSRLFRSNLQFVFHQMKVILSTYLFYCPVRFFGWLAAVFGAASVILAIRLSIYLWWVGPEAAKYKGGTGALLLFTSIVTIVCLVCGFLGSVLSGLRLGLQDLMIRTKHAALEQRIPPFNIEIIPASECSPPPPGETSGG